MSIVIKQVILVVILWLINAASGSAQGWSAYGGDLWSIETPTAAMATPMTYEVDGKQYVVVASGGHLWAYPQKVGDHLVAFAPPE